MRVSACELAMVEAAMTQKRLARIEDEDVSDEESSLEIEKYQKNSDSSKEEKINVDATIWSAEEEYEIDKIKEWREILDYFRANLKIEAVEKEKRSKLWNFLTRKPRLNFKGAQNELSLLIRISQEDYDPAKAEHWCLLCSVYKAIAPFSENSHLAKIGSQWEEIGFQGSDPRTDLNRSMRCLALLQLLALAQDQPKLTASLYELANTTNNDWPLACTSISFTRDAFHELRSGKLFPACNTSKSIIIALNARHQDLFTQFYSRLLAGEDRFEALNRTRGRRICRSGKEPARDAIEKKTRYLYQEDRR